MNESTIKTNISDELKTNYINYAMSVIASRALPDARDGLKPVQRRILYTMYKLNILSNSGYKKVAKIVGEVMGKYHPHGDSSISDALVRMAQSFNMRYVLIDGQGNFGSIDGDPAAAMRYIEARLSKIGEILLENVDNTVEFIPNYDGLDYEPKVLPSSLPNLLINGSEGIAVGMATKIPSHNLSEVIDALTYIIEKGNKYFESTESAKNTVTINYTDSIQFLSDIQKLPPNRFPHFLSQVTTEELLNFIKGPDFPTKGSIYINEDIINVYESGKGNIIMRGSYYIEETKSNKYKIIITELPYQVNKSGFISKIADLYKEKKIDGITDLRDESNKEGIRIVLETRKDIKPQTIINKLYKFTEFQKNFNLNILALVNNEPKQVNLKELLNIFLSHRIEIVIKQLEYELGISKNREHILIGLNKAVNNIDEIIQIIKTSKDTEEAKLNLIKKFELTEMQANAILDMQLKRIASLERQKIENEYKEIKLKISNLIEILSDHNKILSIIKEELIKIKNKYGDQRLTKVIIEKSTNLELEEKDFIQNENTFIIVTQQGYIKRMKQEVYKVQNRGGIGIKSMNTKENDFIKHLFHCQTYDEILFFTNKGKVYKLVAYEIPEYQASAKGIPIINLINIETGELVNCILIVRKSTSKESEEDKNKFIVMTTKKGIVKKTNINEFKNIRSNGIIAITILKGDELVDANMCKSDDEIVIVTNKAKIIKFNAKQLRPTSRMSIGVKGINLKENDHVIKIDILSENSTYLFTISENGFGKLSMLKDFPSQNRGGIGVFCAKTNIKTGNIVSAQILNDLEEDLLVMSAKGNAVRISLKNIPIRKRQTYGVTLIKLKDGDKVMTTTNIKNLNT